MYNKNNFPGGFPANFPTNAGAPGGGRPRFNYPPDRMPPPGHRPQGGDRDRQGPEVDETVSRPIIREEDLTRMDDISRDAGWASTDDIDYNQKLSFSDDEAENDAPTKRDNHHHKKIMDKKMMDEKLSSVLHQEQQQQQQQQHMGSPDDRDSKMRDSRNLPPGEVKDMTREQANQPSAHNRSWNRDRDFQRGPNNGPNNNYPSQQPQQPPMQQRSPHPIRGNCCCFSHYNIFK